MALRIGIVGAGLGGLTAAIALRRQGHIVDVFEASTFSKEVGAALGVPPNAIRVLKSLGCRIENFRGVDIVAYTKCPADGGPAIAQPLRDPVKAYGNRYMTAYRIDIHNELKRLAFGEEGDGSPVRLHLGHNATDCDATLGHVVFANGKHYEGDAIIGADGIRSKIRTTVAGEEFLAPSSKYAAFRWLIDATKLEGNPEFDWIVRDGVLGPRMVPLGTKLMVIYSCRKGTVINAALLHPDERDQDAVEWNIPTTRENLLAHMSDLHPKYQAFANLAPDDLRIWQIRSLPPLPSYVRDRVALLGDAAHAMYPTLASGAAMAIEDGGALGLLLPMGPEKTDVADRLQLYDRIRRPRDEFIRRESYEQVMVPEKRGTFMSSPELQDLVLGFDALDVQLDSSTATTTTN